MFDIKVACSGDGLVHEIFNGLAERHDAGYALSKVAVCHVPCGSSNAMSCNLYGTQCPSFAASAIVKGRRTSINLMSITQGMLAPHQLSKSGHSAAAQANRVLDNLASA